MSDKDKNGEYAAPIKKADTGQRELTHAQKESDENIRKSKDKPDDKK